MNRLTIFMIVSLILFSLIFIGGGSEVVGETPCVDGKNRINLEGIMCEDTQVYWFGLNIYWAFSLVLIELIMAFWMIKGDFHD